MLSFREASKAALLYLGPGRGFGTHSKSCREAAAPAHPVRAVDLTWAFGNALLGPRPSPCPGLFQTPCHSPRGLDGLCLFLSPIHVPQVLLILEEVPNSLLSPFLSLSIHLYFLRSKITFSTGKIGNHHGEFNAGMSSLLC